MAKLNVTYPAVDVMVNGQAYRKVDRKAQAGDIVKAIAPNVDITVGQFYAVNVDSSDELYVVDNEEDRNGALDNYPRDFEVYAPLSVDPPAAPSDELTFGGATYRKVGRSAREGDVIVFTENTAYVSVGKPYLVNEIDSADDAQITDDDGDDFDTCAKEFDVYEKVAEEATQAPDTPAAEYREVKRKANVGERIRIVAAYNTIGKYDDGDELTVASANQLWGEAVRVSEFYQPVIYDREYVVLEPVKPQTPAKPNVQSSKYAAGDFVKVTDTSGSHNAVLGDIAEVTEVLRAVNPENVSLVYVKTMDGRTYAMFSRRFAPATPEEVSAAQAEATAQLQRKIAIGPFADGGFAQIVNASADNASPTPRSTPKAFVRVETTTSSRLRALKVTYVDGDYGYCNADALRQITEAEYNAAVAKLAESAQETARWAAINRKVGEFKRGDIVEATRRMGKGERVLGVVRDVSPVGIPALGVQLPEGAYYSVNSAGAALIVPVEQRFDNAA